MLRPNQRIEIDAFMSALIPGHGIKTFNRGHRGRVVEYDSFLSCYRIELDAPFWPTGFTIIARESALLAL
jgi:hypothetical protein